LRDIPAVAGIGIDTDRFLVEAQHNAPELSAIGSPKADLVANGEIGHQGYASGLANEFQSLHNQAIEKREMEKPDVDLAVTIRSVFPPIAEGMFDCKISAQDYVPGLSNF